MDNAISKRMRAAVIKQRGGLPREVAEVREKAVDDAECFD
jgi:hypothetical protein